MRAVKAVGYRILVRLKPAELEKEVVSKGGILLEVKTDSKLQREREAISEAYVVDIGPDAYKDVGSGKPWCKVGDCVLVSRYSGTLIENIGDDENIYRMINDQDVQANFPEDKLK